MQKSKKIFLIVCVVLLVALSAVSVFADLPSGTQSSGSTIDLLLTEEDARLLLSGLIAQAQLQVPFNSIVECFILTAVHSADGYSYRLYTNYPNRDTADFTPTFYKSDGTLGVGYGGFMTSGKSGIILSSRYVSVAASGGIGGKIADCYFNNTIQTIRFSYQLESTEVVLAYYHNGTVLSFGSGGVYGVSNSDYLTKVAPVRNMANSWIEARDVKRDGLSGITDEAYNSGFEAGQTNGYNNGYRVGKQEGYNSGYETGRAEAQSEAYQQGYNSGYETGKAEGGTGKYQEGYEYGYLVGQDAGYKKGFAAGQEAGGGGVQLDIPAVISAVPIAVKNFVNTSFGFEVFGINVAGLLSVIMIVALLVYLVRRFKG